MSPVIRIPDSVYKRLESHVAGFDTPAGVIERLLDFYEGESKEKRFARTAISDHKQQRSYKRKTTDRFNRVLDKDKYTITSPQGVTKIFSLPPRHDKQGIKRLTDEIQQFVQEQGGTIGQINAARKKLTENGYHIT